MMLFFNLNIECGIRKLKNLQIANVETPISIRSGRKSTQNNLLSCDILEGRLSELAGRRFYLSGKLIRE